VYHSAFPDFGGWEDEVAADRITDFENLVQKRIVWAYFSNNWFDGIEFPEASVRAIHDSGHVPFIRMMARSSRERALPDPVYTLQRIIDGDFDGDLRAWAQRAKQIDFPIMVEFGTEVNGDWFPWSGALNGGGETGRYGDPAVADGPERFQDAYRHIIDICRGEGALGITWVFHVDDLSLPAEDWNSMSAYYPGDDYIDWIGISVYGPLRPGEDWDMFSKMMDDAYPQLASISESKPLAVLEYGVVEDPASGSKSLWIHDALKSIRSGKYPRIKAVSYWHENWENDDGTVSALRIDSSPESLEAYQEEIADPFFLSELQRTAAITTLTTSEAPSTHTTSIGEKQVTSAAAVSSQIPPALLTILGGVATVAVAIGLMLFARKPRREKSAGSRRS
jgi:hypothetical protein